MKSNKIKQKKEELEMATEFLHRNAWDYSLDGNTVEPQPDIIMRESNGHHIGHELTRSKKKNGEAEMKVAGMKDLFLERIPKFFYDKYGYHISGNLYFNVGKLDFSKKEINKHLDPIVDYIHKQIPFDIGYRTGVHINNDFNYDIGGYPMPEFVSNARIVKVPDESGALLTGGITGPEEITKDLIQRIIDKKEPKVSGYKKSCKEVWLLIYEYRYAATWLNNTELVLNMSFKSSFDRVFYMTLWDRQCYELQITNK